MPARGVVTGGAGSEPTLTLVTPGGPESFPMEVGVPAPGGRPPAQLPEPDLERVVTLAAHHGAEVLTDWP